MRSISPRTWNALIGRVRAIRPGLWLLPVFTFVSLYLYRPFVLGFYSDDWSGLLEATHHGGPFSAGRFIWHWDVFARPLMRIEIYLSTSVLGTSAVAWHFFMIALIALTYVVLRRFLLALGARPTAATLASTAWLVFPWALGYRVWPITSVILLSTICFLAASIALLRQRLWRAVAWYAASMLLYEAFYFQFIVILLFLVSSTETRRWALRRATPALVLLQMGVVALNRVAAAYAPGQGKSYDQSWYVQFGRLLPRIPLTLSQGIAGGSTLALITVEAALLFAFVCAFRTVDRGRRVKLLGAALGIVVSFFVLTLAGYQLTALGTTSRTFACIDIWIVVFLALPWERPVQTRRVRLVLGVAIAAVFVILAVSTALNTTTWQRTWTNEKTVLATIPIESVAATDSKAVIVALGLPYAKGFPTFGADYIMNNAVLNGIPGTRVSRSFYPARPGADLSWDGEWLLLKGSKMLEAPELWVWRWPTKTLESVTSPGKLL